MLVVWPPPCTKGNKTRGGFGRKRDSEDGGEQSGRGLPEDTLETHLHVGKVRGYPLSYPIGSLTLARYSL
jgi:hypothetical protein